MSSYVHDQRRTRLRNPVTHLFVCAVAVLGIVGLGLIVAAAYGVFVPACHQPTTRYQGGFTTP